MEQQKKLQKGQARVTIIIPNPLILGQLITWVNSNRVKYYSSVSIEQNSHFQFWVYNISTEDLGSSRGHPQHQMPI